MPAPDHRPQTPCGRTRPGAALTRSAALALAAALSMSGCAGQAPPDPGRGAETASPGPQPLQTPTQTQRPDIAQRDDLRDERDLPWIAHEVVDEFQIRLRFAMGDPFCHGVRAEVADYADTIRVRLYLGRLPTAPPACDSLLVFASTVVTTADPIGSRAVVPG